MSRGVNKAIVIGNLTRDPEVRYSPAGAAVTNISVATNEEWKDKNTGEKQERTEFHRIVAFARLAEIMGEYLKKGSQVYIEGRIQTRKWQDKEGNDRYTTEIVANNMQLLGSKDSSTGDGAGSNASHQRPQESPATSGAGDDFDDDIPF